MWIISVVTWTFWQRKNPHRKLIYGNVVCLVFGALSFPLNVTAFWLNRTAVVFAKQIRHRFGRFEVHYNLSQKWWVAGGACQQRICYIFPSFFSLPPKQLLLPFDSPTCTTWKSLSFHCQKFPNRSSFLSLGILFLLLFFFRIVVNSNVSNSSRVPDKQNEIRSKRKANPWCFIFVI